MTPTPWHLGPLTAFDTESTGVDTREARIVTGYAATVGSRAQRRRIVPGADVLINPGVPIPPESTKVHGVTDEIAQAKGCDPRDGVNAIAEAVARSLVAQIPVVCHNAPYDFALLYWECLRWDLPTVAERMGYPPAAAVGPVIDTYVLDQQFDQYRKGSGRRKLEYIAPHVYGVPLDAAHTADADALAAVRVAVAIAERYAGPDLPTDPVALHRLQKLWRADQSISRQRYFRTKGGRPDAYVDPCWPLCTDVTHPTG